MIDLVMERRRTGWDVAIGLLLVVGGIVVLGHVVVATVVSILLIGWLTLVAGVLALVDALFRIGKGGFWSAALTGGLLTVLGLVLVRNTAAAAVTLTLLAGAFFLAAGVVRLVAAVELTTYRWVLVVSGIGSTALGLIVLFNLVDVSFALLGTLLGIELIIDGVTIALEGRMHLRRFDDTPAGAPAV